MREVRWRSRFDCDERQVQQYGHGRVFLAGDAAHVHSPIGGQGMNTGMQDAINLAWKLELALRGAPDSILDSYQRERHPIGRRVLLQSGLMLRAITLGSPAARALLQRAAGALFAWPRFAGLVAESFSGVGLRYRRARGDQPPVGTRADAVPLAAGRWGSQQLEPGFVLVRERGAPPLRASICKVQRADDGPALLVRPDGYIAWAGPSATPLRPDVAAGARELGAPGGGASHCARPPAREGGTDERTARRSSAGLSAPDEGLAEAPRGSPVGRGRSLAHEGERAAGASVRAAQLQAPRLGVGQPPAPRVLPIESLRPQAGSGSLEAESVLPVRHRVHTAGNRIWSCATTRVPSNSAFARRPLLPGSSA